MKNLLFAVSLLTSIGFTTVSCSREDDKTTKVDNSWVYGTWNVKEVKFTENGVWVNASSKNWYAKFNNDGTYSSKDIDVYSGTYTVSGNVITCKVGGETVIYNIIERNGNKAIAKMSFASSPNDFIWFKIEK